ncbi:diadenylate cyclase CdaA [Alicyclobacillus acidoterrestris]|uniref:Diadenylate cyclase n=1 Tax=Alicyclobacillus acidoterrestris (strain ATCC 49025 / DSM 3922 / CIP 106132 / NCIMB 13137 / GD3B) TaxID=1356854 RepID=T0D2Z4_ALIAG|nr:diadenylate cyclase CdaA [Alicyclobacillus acidoterrestris]EPZ45942.1 membrane protein [Alicyclobacillus acidoterrestris ATCC 49025]UNO49330.1 diadenylate cyclase CdaA [Alicyclobacillus acidoterrestris]
MDTWLAVVRNFSFKDVIDILFVAFVLYFLLLLIRGTRAVQLLKGAMIVVIVTLISQLLHLSASNWLLGKIIQIGFFAIPVVFQPELRRALEQLGRGGFWSLSLNQQGQEEDQQTVNEIVKATQVLSKTKIGALIVIERRTGLSEYIETGTSIEGHVSSELFINLFIPNTPLHDGAVIVRNNQIVAAGCFLPLTENRSLDKQLGTRHRAALGITEQSDGVAVVVSEETGRVSVGVDGVLHRSLDEQGLKTLLTNLLVAKRSNSLPFWNRKAES